MNEFTVKQIEREALYIKQFNFELAVHSSRMLRAFAARLREDDENAKDAARYQWLRDSDGAGGRIYCAMDQFEADGQCIATLLSGDQLDEAIDDAMREQGEG